MVGYNGNFPTPLAEHHKCPCCSYALRDPLQTECGHRICKECYAELQRKSGRTGQIICPVDGSIVLPHQVFPDMYAKREVLNLATHCMYRNSGCQWHGVLKDYEDHIIRCEYEDIRCPNGCNERLPKHLIEQHLLQSCPRRLVECEYCKAKIPSEELEDHYEKCELFPVDCLYNCGTIKIPRKLLQQHHENECPNAVGACSYSFIGCNFKGTKDEVLDHLAKESTEHLRLATKCCIELWTKITELSRKYENEAKRAGILEQMVSGQAEDLEAIKFQCNELRDAINSLGRNMDELKGSGQIRRENLNQIQRRAGPAVAMEMDRLREQARLMEQKGGKALQKGNNVQVTQMTLSGASSLPVDMVGYNGNFPTPLAEHHKCPCCSYALRDPVQTDCGHRICKECYADLQRKSGRTGLIICPVDGSIVLLDEVHRDMLTKGGVLNPQIYCMYRSSGCQWQGILKEYVEHMKGCEYGNIHCPNGCHQRLPRYLTEQHLLQSCSRRLVQCECSKATICSEESKDHYEKCEQFPVDCLYNCDAIEIPHKLLQQHDEDECPNAFGACCYSFAGCNAKSNVSRSRQTRHLIQRQQ